MWKIVKGYIEHRVVFKEGSRPICLDCANGVGKDYPVSYRELTLRDILCREHLSSPKRNKIVKEILEQLAS